MAKELLVLLEGFNSCFLQNKSTTYTVYINNWLEQDPCAPEKKNKNNYLAKEQPDLEILIQNDVFGNLNNRHHGWKSLVPRPKERRLVHENGKLQDELYISCTSQDVKFFCFYRLRGIGNTTFPQSIHNNNTLGLGKKQLYSQDFKMEHLKVFLITSPNPTCNYSFHPSIKLLHPHPETPESLPEDSTMQSSTEKKGKSDEPPFPQPNCGSKFPKKRGHVILFILTLLVGACLHGAFGAPRLPLLEVGNRLKVFVLCNSLVFFASLAFITFLLCTFALGPWLLMLICSAIGVYMCAIMAFSPQLLVPVLFIATSIFLVASMHILRRNFKTPIHDLETEPLLSEVAIKE